MAAMTKNASPMHNVMHYSICLKESVFSAWSVLRLSLKMQCVALAH